MLGNADLAAACGVAFGVVLCRVLPRGWAFWQEAVAVGAVCVAVYAVLRILGRRIQGDESPK